jgi:hypothetical protein
METTDLQKLEQVATLRKQREVLVEAIGEMRADADKVEIHELYGEISEIDAKLHAIDPSLV